MCVSVSRVRGAGAGAVVARIRLRTSPQYLLVISQWKLTVSANLRKTSTKIAQNVFKSLLAKLPSALCRLACHAACLAEARPPTMTHVRGL